MRSVDGGLWVVNEMVVTYSNQTYPHSLAALQLASATDGNRNRDAVITRGTGHRVVGGVVVVYSK